MLYILTLYVTINIKITTFCHYQKKGFMHIVRKVIPKYSCPQESYTFFLHCFIYSYIHISWKFISSSRRPSYRLLLKLQCPAQTGESSVCVFKYFFYERLVGFHDTAVSPRTAGNCSFPKWNFITWDSRLAAILFLCCRQSIAIEK